MKRSWVADLFARNGKIMLNLGAGERERRIPGFTNVDIRTLPNVDIVAAVDKLDMFGDNSVDLIYSAHVLEHFGRNETERVLGEWHRVLKLGGILRLAVPDFEKVVELYLKTKDLKLLLGHLVGGQDYPGNLHRMVFDFELLSELLSGVGFVSIRRYDWRQTIHKDYDDYSQAYWPHLDKEHGTLMSLNVEAEK